MFHKELSGMIGMIVEKRSLVSAISCVLFDASKQTVSMSDLDNYVTLGGVPITGKGLCMVDAYALKAIAAATKKKFALRFEGNCLHVDSDDDTYELQTQDPDTFPIMTETKITTTAENLPLSLFNVVLCATEEETRYYLKGVCLHSHENGMRSIATDGHRLALRYAPAKITGEGFAKKASIILPTKAITTIQKIFSDSVTISLHGHDADSPARFSIKQGAVSFYGKLIDGNFPGYERVIPSKDDAAIHLTLDGKEVARLMAKRSVVGGMAVLLQGDIKRGLSMTLKGDKSKLVKHLQDYTHRIALDVGFNALYMADIIEDMVNKDFTMHIQNPPYAPMRIENGGNLYVLMPMRV